jgi:ABC-type Fe3+-hydroxamate transport system substrate-binding protein/adenosylcobinamide amidohydrolase
MITDKRFKFYYKFVFNLLVLLLFFFNAPVQAEALTFTDSGNHQITIGQRPARVVSLVPGITETIFALGAGDRIVGRTYHGSWPPETADIPVMGGFFSPDLEKIKQAKPDMIFYSSLQKKVIDTFAGSACAMVNLETGSLADSYQNIILLGRIFEREKEARRLVNNIKDEMTLISKKIDKIPEAKRCRVMRIMGRESMMTPGSDSFQSEMIRAAGGIVPDLGKTGSVVPVTREEWVKFNPQVIYGCGGDRALVASLLGQPGWKDVDAVKSGRIYFFPCDLTCRAATHTGYFVSWLAARLYSGEFVASGAGVLEDKIFKTRPVDIDLDYIEAAKIAYSRIYDFTNKTLVIDFKKPLDIVSTLAGFKTDIKTVGNHYASQPCWAVAHRDGMDAMADRICRAMDRRRDTSSFMMTGADMDKLSVQTAAFRDMRVYALVTAGVSSNALRTSVDTGHYYEPGTINIILLTNMTLSQRAMTRAIITATEAKTAALADLDIRSSFSGMRHQATGTGTDNIIVVQGTGVDIDNSGGHTKMGELLAKAVYAGVTEAVFKQNGHTPARNVFQRLNERQTTVFELLTDMPCNCAAQRPAFFEGVERLLLDPFYAGFIQSALALSDAYEKGLVGDLESFEIWCRDITRGIAGETVDELTDFVVSDKIPTVQKMALNALINGVWIKIQAGED